MEFIFDRPDDPVQERYEIALLLDRKKLKEHILIGIRAEIQRRLQGVKDAAVFLDVERELGTLLTEFTQINRGCHLYVYEKSEESIRRPAAYRIHGPFYRRNASLK